MKLFLDVYATPSGGSRRGGGTTGGAPRDSNRVALGSRGLNSRRRSGALDSGTNDATVTRDVNARPSLPQSRRGIQRDVGRQMRLF